MHSAEFFNVLLQYLRDIGQSRCEDDARELAQPLSKALWRRLNGLPSQLSLVIHCAVSRSCARQELIRQAQADARVKVRCYRRPRESSHVCLLPGTRIA